MVHNNTLKQVIQQEYKKCALDPVYFMRKYCVIQHPKKGKVKFDLYDFIDPEVLDTAVFRSYLHNFIEIDWKQNRIMDAIRNYHIISYDFQGYDPRGNELFKHLESGVDYHSSISKYINYKLSGYYHHKYIDPLLQVPARDYYRK